MNQQTKTISQIEEKEIVSIMDDTIIITRVDSMFYFISETGIHSSKEILKQLDQEYKPSNKSDMFKMLSSIGVGSSNFKTEINKEIINTRFVLD